MTGDPLDDLPALEPALARAADEAVAYLRGLASDPVVPAGAADAVEAIGGAPLPEAGDGALAAIAELAEHGRAGATRSAGPRFFHFVVGGATPAALAADWLTAAFDQVGFAWISSPLAARVEAQAVAWLRDLFELPADFAGVLVTGATMASFTGLAAAREWWAQRHGFDVGERGMAGAPALPVLSSGHLHPSAVQALAMLGVGRSSIRRFAADGTGRLDVDALAAALDALGGAPAVLVGNAGEVNAGEFDDLEALAELADRHDAWLHVDGAFGLFARVTPQARHLAAGAERADSICVDGHKWLNVPYDSGMAFVRDPALLGRAFHAGAPYLPGPDEPHPNYGYLGPENSRRARAFAVWATLRAYGRRGHRAMVERHLALARRLAARVDAEPDLERLADVPLNIVCFRWRPAGVEDPERLDDLNRALGEALLADGRVFAGTTVRDDVVAFRPAIVNHRTTERDVDALVEVLLELASGVLRAAA